MLVCMVLVSTLNPYNRLIGGEQWIWKAPGEQCCLSNQSCILQWYHSYHASFLYLLQRPGPGLCRQAAWIKREMQGSKCLVHQHIIFRIGSVLFCCYCLLSFYLKHFFLTKYILIIVFRLPSSTPSSLSPLLLTYESAPFLFLIRKQMGS